MNNQTQLDQQSLLMNINHYIRLNAPTLTADTQKWMASQLTDWVISAVAKFERGQKEHGGDIKERDLLLELKFEVLDLFWYLMAEKQKRAEAMLKHEKEQLVKHNGLSIEEIKPLEMTMPQRQALYLRLKETFEPKEKK